MSHLPCELRPSAMWHAFAGTLLAASLGCNSGNLTGTDNLNGPNNNGAESGVDVDVGKEEPSDPEAQQTSVSMYRLTLPQYGRAITNAFDGKVTVPALSIADLKIAGFTAVGASQVGVPQADAEAFTEGAYSLGVQLVDPAMRANYPCVPKGVVDDNCVGQIIDKYAERLLRRPLTAEERVRYLKLAATRAQQENDFWQGMQAAFSALLQAPSFLFRVDTIRANSADPTELDSYALASRLSYLIWDEGPDAQLLAAAKAELLYDPKALAEQVDRLLFDPRAAVGLSVFLRENLRLDDILHMEKDANDLTPAQRDDLFQQALLTVQAALLEQDGDYRDLMTTQTMATNASLSKRYNFPAAQGANFRLVKMTADDRSGLLGLPGVAAMLSPAYRSSITSRGKYIRDALLCMTVPPAPAGVSTSITVIPNAPRTLRQSMAAHVMSSSCAGCHSFMDPLAYALESFDQLGRYRTTDNGLPLDLTGQHNGKSYTSARTFAALLHDDPELLRCVVSKFLSHARGSQTSIDDAGVEKLLAEFTSGGYRLKGLIRAYARSAEFTRLRQR